MRFTHYKVQVSSEQTDEEKVYGVPLCMNGGKSLCEQQVREKDEEGLTISSFSSFRSDDVNTVGKNIVFFCISHFGERHTCIYKLYSRA